MNRENNVAFPSRKDIAEGCGIKKEETVDKALKVLVEKGLIEKYHRYTNAGDYGSNVYKLKL
jgi:DNA-binding GntR family transcriptional regulator